MFILTNRYIPKNSPQPFSQSATTGNVVLKLKPASIEVVALLKPDNCNAGFNTASKGVLPVAITGASINVNEIDVATIQLSGITPNRSNSDDVVGTSCATAADGASDLAMHFDTSAIVTSLGEVSDGDMISLPLTGMNSAGVNIIAEVVATVGVKGKSKKK